MCSYQHLALQIDSIEPSKVTVVREPDLHYGTERSHLMQEGGRVMERKFHCLNWMMIDVCVAGVAVLGIR